MQTASTRVVKQQNTYRVVLWACATLLVLACATLHAADDSDPARQLRELQQQNRVLQEQLRQQQELLQSLARQIKEIQNSDAQHKRDLEHVEAELQESAPAIKSPTPLSFGKINLSGEGAVAFFNSGSQGMTPHAEFRIDEARLFLEAPVWQNVYFFSELDLASRESTDLGLTVGELYLDAEDLSRLWGRDRMLNLRLGRFYIPFGEEYQERFAIDNPLISNSLSDLWGTDEGVELYGRLGKFSYVAAVQNGGIADARDFDADKSIAGRIGFDPTRWLHLSVSGMRTGDLDVSGDGISAIWFGNGFFRSLGSAATTKFHAELAEGDIQVQWPHGHLKTFGGYIHYSDNDPAADNQRDVFYYSVEGVHDLFGNLYGGVRFSQVLVDKGFPIVGGGRFDDYFAELTQQLWRLSLGVGYRWSQNFLLKAEYTFERGKEINGERRNHEDLFALQAAFKF